ncbi:MAG TPA: MBL fold metallo-hydrolase [Candidatus Binatia bacterium]|jgi:metallo-beta-lactamase family protein|nr:MBL fold metallo-hydrolase [Candidatus Binatia bacterium]
MKITFHGAAREVTGSCELVETPTTRVLVDCGLFQGNGMAYERNMAPFPFEPSSVDAVILTHAHIDHIGRIPKLVKAGFSGRIFATHPTRLLARLMWQDASHVMKDEARHHKRAPVYMPKDVGPAFDLLHGVPYDTTVRISNDFSFCFREAGHIFGSGFVEADVYGTRLVCSGDLGNDYVPILRPTARIVNGDVVVMESTYGDRIHENPKVRAERLKAAVLDSAKRKGTLLIPAFSLERAQEILYELNNLVESKQVPALPTFLDSPLAIKALPIYHQFPEYYDQEAKELKASGDDFFKFPGLEVTKKPEESRRIIGVPSPKIVIAGSGMMHGGRIMHHLVDYLSDPNTTVLVVGYQSAGTVGRAIAEGQKMVRIEHTDVEVRAKIDIIGSYSAHADQVKLLKWVSSGRKMPKKVYLNHGEPHASEALAQKIRDEFAVDVAIPAPGDGFTHP